MRLPVTLPGFVRPGALVSTCCEGKHMTGAMRGRARLRRLAAHRQASQCTDDTGYRLQIGYLPVGGRCIAARCGGRQ